MILQGRNLTQGLNGADVGQLLGELTTLGYAIPADEQQRMTFGPGTLAAVQQFQRAQGLSPNGIVDATTAAALTSVISISFYTVTGTVTSATRAAVGALTVSLIDKNVGGDQVLANGQTDHAGAFSFAKVSITPDYLRRHSKSHPDLQVLALSGGTQIGASAVRYDAPTTLTLDILLAAAASGLPSEHETLSTSLGALYSGSLADLQETEQRQDITYLANKTGWDARAVALAALAAQFSAITVPAGTSPTAPAAIGLRPEFYYALFRAGLPANPDMLFRVGTSTIQVVWQQAITEGVIPQSLAQQIPAAVTTFQALSAAHVLTAPPPAGLSTLQQMVAPTLPNAAQQQQFAQIYTEYRDNVADFWPAVERALGTASTKQLQFTGQLHYLTANNQPLVNALSRAEAHSPLTSTLDLATRGYYNAAQWTPLIGTSIPAGIPGGTADEQRNNYAELLAAQVRIAFPTATLADRVRRGSLAIADTPAVATGVADFLSTHQDQFAIGVEPVEAYIARQKVAGTPAEVITQVKRLQRVYQLTPDDSSFDILLRHNLDSAFAVTRYDSVGFIRTFGGKLGGSAKAAAIHTRAKQVFGAVLSIATAYANARMAPGMGGRSPVQNAFPAPAPLPTYPVIAYPTLEDLFGSLDYCTCSDCNSILSPAAYFVDLLHYLDQPAPSPNFQNPQDALLARRPDLQYLPLTCENTNTALPYIDVVNETLEYFVANNLSLANYQGHDTGTGVTSAELLANPQYVNDAAYAILESAFFPPPLPFNRPLELLRLQLQNLDVALPDAMIALRSGDKLTDTTTPTSYGWSDILIEQLGMSRNEYRLFADSTVGLGDLYGLPNGTALATLANSNLKEFSRRVGVSYVDLVAILQTRFINPDAVLIPRVQQLNAPFATLRTLHDNLGTPASIAPQFIAALPPGLDATQYGAASPTDYAAVVAWVTDAGIYPRIMGLITITNPDGGTDDCSGAALQFRYANPDNTKNLLSGTDFLKLIRFIRLWRKLTPLLAGDDATTIAQTDAIVSALYPAADLPTNSSDTTHDAANRALLDAGFPILLRRAGFLFQVLNRLSLTANASLDQLLACWAPIRTVGAKALYQRMFLTSNLLQHDPGAQIATVGNAIGAGDVLATTINGVSIAPHTVTPGETPAAAATAIATAVNATATPDPASGLPLNSRFFATSQGSIVTIKAGVTLGCAVSLGASETYTAGVGSPLSRSATVAGSVAAGDVLTTTINTVAILYTVAASDSGVTIAARIAAAVNATTVPDPYSGLPLNTLVFASSASATVTITAANAGAPFALACTLAAANNGTYTAGPPKPPTHTATVAGTVHTGDTLVTTINGVAIPYAATAADTSAALLATRIAATISNTVAHDPTTGLPLSSLVHAIAVGGIVTITALDPTTAFTLACSVTTGSETYVAAGPFPASQTATVAGTMPAGAVLTTTVNDLDLYYTVAAGETAAVVAGKVAALIDATASPDMVTGLPLNSVVTATAAGSVVTVTATSPTGSFILGVSLSASSYIAGRKSPPFADNGYGDFLADTTQTLFGHEPLLCAAFNLTGAEFALISGALAFDAATPLTLDNVSALFRHGWLARKLNISVLEFLRLCTYTALDPFEPLDPGAVSPAEPAVIRLIRLLQAIAGAGMHPVQALYLLWNQDISGKSAPSSDVVTGLASALRSAFGAVEAQFTLQDDPDGTIAEGLMALVYGNTASDFFFGLLNNTFSVAITYANPAGQPALPQPVLDASGDRLRYDDLRKQLSFAGVLDTAMQAALIAAGTVNTTDATDNVAAGAGVVFAPASMSNIALGSVLVIDTGGAQETVAVTATTPTGFTTTTTKAHNGTVTPFAIANDPTLLAGIAALATANQQATGAFFAAYPELQPLYSAYAASSAPLQDRRTVLLANFLPTLKQKRKQEEALASVTAAAGSDPSFAYALLQDSTVLHADSDAAAPAVADFVAIEGGGLSAQFFLGNNPGAPPDQSVDAVPVLSYPGAATLPGGGGPMAAVWSGYIAAPQDAFYNFAVDADAGAAITLQIDGAVIAGTVTGGVWHNQSAVSLTAGKLVRIVLTAISLHTTLALSWQTLGLGWQVVPGRYLFSATLTTRLGDTYVRFLKAASLAADLSLTADEIVYLGRGSLASLVPTGDPDPVAAAKLGGLLMNLLEFARIKVALSPDDERLLAVLESAATAVPGDLSALLSLTGWSQLSVTALMTRFFGNAQPANLATVENVRRIYDAYAIVDACRLSAAVLIASVTNAPSATTVSALQSALRSQYAESDWLTVVQPINDTIRIRQRDALVAYILQRIGDQYAQSVVVKTTTAAATTGATGLTLTNTVGVSAGMLVGGTNIGPGTVVLTVVGTAITLNLGVLGALPAGAGLSFAPAGSVEMNTPDKLYEYFLIDPETQPAVQTSRIALAISSAQLFIERIVRNLEPLVSPSDVDPTQWQWMKRYRVWQANREVFLWPENWLYPELRDNQSPFFEQMMSSLLQGDITDDAAANAYLDYLTNLEQVAKLEPCGLYYEPGTATTNEESYVVARTAGAHRKYYFRELQSGGWTPWTEVKIDCEDMPLTPIVWNGRLFLFWLKIIKQAAPQSQGSAAQANNNLKNNPIGGLAMGDLQTFGSAAISAQHQVTVFAVLNWSEYYNGKWQPTKTSDVNNPAILGDFDQSGPNSFEADRNRVRIVPAQYDPTDPALKAEGVTFTLPDGALILAIVTTSGSPGPANGFVLYNTHSLPVRLQDIYVKTLFNIPSLSSFLEVPNPRRNLTPSMQYSGGNTTSTTSFTISYFNTPTGTPAHTVNILGFDWRPHYVEPQFGLPDAWDAPFFYEDRRYLFYVTTAENYVTIWRYGGFGLNFGAATQKPPVFKIPPLTYPVTPVVPKDPIVQFTVNPIDTGDPAGLQRFVNEGTNIRVALGTGTVVTYQGRDIAPTGSIAIPGALSTPEQGRG